MNTIYELLKSRFTQYLNLAIGIALLVLVFSSVSAKPNNKIEVCHVPPDNPTNSVLININANAVGAHQSDHGDLVTGLLETEGDGDLCEDGIDNDCDGLIDEEDVADCGGRAFRYVFITSQTFDGNMGGLAGADALCNIAADASTSSKLIGHNAFTAWLSDSNTDAIDRVSLGNGVEYRQLDSGDTLTFPAAASSPYIPLVAIITDENGDDNMLGSFVWTATLNNGTEDDNEDFNLCLNWTSTEGGLIDIYGFSTPGHPLLWTNSGVGVPPGCNNALKLYCFENQE